MEVNKLALAVVIEDSDEDFETIERVMRRTGVANIARAANGDRGLELFDDDNLRRRVGFVLLDLNIPGSSGREVLCQIKKHPELSALPVVIFTTSNNPRDVEGCYHDGANSYHVKPFDLGAFENAVSHIADYWLKDVVPSNPWLRPSR